MLPVPDGSLADIGQHGLAHYPAGPAHDGVADAVRCEELTPGVAVQRILVVQQAPGVVEAAEAVWLQGGGYASALNINSRTQILQSLISFLLKISHTTQAYLRTVQTPRPHQLRESIERTIWVI